MSGARWVSLGEIEGLPVASQALFENAFAGKQIGRHHANERVGVRPGRWLLQFARQGNDFHGMSTFFTLEGCLDLKFL